MALRLAAAWLVLCSLGVADQRACPKCDYHLPKAYAIANGAHGAAQTASYRGEYFDVYSKPIRTRYGEVVNVFNFAAKAAVPLPDEIVRRFNGSVMAIVGFEPNIVERSADGTERLVPCTAMYNHHWSHVLLGAGAPPVGLDDAAYYDYPGAGAVARGNSRAASAGSEPEDRWVGLAHHELHEAWAKAAVRRVLPGAPRHAAIHGGAQSREDDALETAPTAQFFSEGNGNEHRLSYHGYPRGYAQLIKSPAAFAPGIMFINTKDVSGTSSTGHGTMVPRVALADGQGDYSPLLECPCGTRRTMDVARQQIDGRKVHFGCAFKGEGTGVGRAMLKHQNNTACRMDTLHGGSKCCDNGMILLDADQPQPEQVSTFYYKQRFYFEEATKAHRNLFRVYWQAELKNNEYDVPVCPLGTAPADCVFVLTNEGVARETLWPADPTAPGGWDKLTWPADGSGIQLVYAGGHCHVGCLSLDLINLDTGATICHQEPVLGTRVSATGDNAMDERGYSVAIPPCLWGEHQEDNLSPPVVIRPDDRLQIVARYNATRMRSAGDAKADPATLNIAHYAVMSMYQMRASFADPAPDFHV